MTAIHWTIVVTVLATFVVCTAFPMVFALKPLHERGEWMPLSVRVTAYVWLIVGVPADALYNLIPGTIQFRELPREIMFSGRIQRLVDEGDGWRLAKAVRWAGFLNAIDPGHIKRVPA